MKPEVFSSLVGTIYEAALEPHRWPKVLQEVGRPFDARAVNIAILDGMGLPSNFLAYGIPSDLQQLFLQKYSTPDLNAFASIAVSKPVGDLIKSWEAPELASFRETEMYHELYRPLGVYDGIGVILERSTSSNIALGILLPEDRNSRRDSETQLASALAPHIRQALQVSARLEEMRGERGLLADALHKVRSVGVILVESTGAVILANEAAEEIARQRDGFSIGPSGLSGASADLTFELRKLIASASQPGADYGGGHIRLTRPSGLRPFLAIVSPAGKTEWTLLPRRPAAIVLISDPERQVLLAPERLASLFGLTRREGQIAALLAQGADLGEAAERLGLSRGTVHTHLKRILEKTGTHRQAELVSLLLRSLAGLGQ